MVLPKPTPTISLFGAAMKAGLKVFGKLAKRLKKGKKAAKEAAEKAAKEAAEKAAKEAAEKAAKEAAEKAAKESAEKAAKEAAEKAKIPKKIHDGGQGKHIPGHNNYLPGRSTVSENPQKLLDDFHNGNIKSSQKLSDQKTRVDFGKEIGQFTDPTTGITSPTTVGMIHSGKNGAHIVPAKPK